MVRKLKLISFAAVATIMLGMTGCMQEKDENVNVNPEGSTVVKFKLGGTSSLVTKSTSDGSRPVQTDKIQLSEDNDTEQVFLVETEQKIDDLYYGGKAFDTKGSPVYTENFVQLYKQFKATPFQYTEGKKDLSDFDSEKECWLIDETELTYGYTLTNSWPASGKKLLFFMYAPSAIADAGVTLTANSFAQDDKNPDNGIISFNYSAPGVTDGVCSDPTLLKDILFTSKSMTKETASESKVLFYHALAGVKFKSANAERELNKDRTLKTANKGEVKTVIKSITITNVKSTGTCTITPDQTYGADDSNASASVDKSSKATVWGESLSNPVTYKLTGLTDSNVVSNDGSLYSEKTAFEGVSATDSSQDAGLGQYNLNASDFSKTFFFIPQTTTESEITIVYDVYKGNNKILSDVTKTVPFNQKWKAGYLYTYTLSANSVDVTITDTMNPDKTIKSNTVITNTGNTDAFLRAAIVGGWYDSHGDYRVNGQLVEGDHQLVAPWGGINDTDEGNTTYDTENWIYCETDGFYYYKYKVKPGMTAYYPLLSEYEALTCPDPLYEEYGHLELNICVQAINVKDVGLMEDLGWEMTFPDAGYDPGSADKDDQNNN